MFIVVFFLITGFFFIYKSKKTNAKLLSYLGLGVIFNGLIWSSSVIDLLTILMTGNNLNPVYLFPIFARMWMGPSMVCWVYLASELLIPKRKKIIVIVFGILAIIFELFLIFDTQNNYNINTPVNPGEDLLDSTNVIPSPNFIIFTLFSFFLLIFYIFGFLYKSFQSTGVLRKKYRYISIGVFIFLSFSAFDGLFSKEGGYLLVIVRLVMTSSVPFLYLGLREEPEKIKIKPAEKEVKIKDSLFRIRERPAQITEEEVTYYKEQKICLVCKGKVGGFNNYICTGCDVMYCENCARSLINLENVCWVCDEPIDKSKPVKPIERTEAGKKDIRKIPFN